MTGVSENDGMPLKRKVADETEDDSVDERKHLKVAGMSGVSEDDRMPLKRKVADETEDDSVDERKHLKVAGSSSQTSCAVTAPPDNSKKLMEQFYEQSCQDLAKALLGKKLARKLDNGDIVAGHIVETEAYLGGQDKASHSFGGKKTAKNEAMFMEPGTIYVYNIYGVMTCVNISSQGEGAAVLIRAIDATDGLDVMRKSRGVKRPDEGRGMAEKDLGNGPSKLTQALNISKAEFNKESITESDNIWIQEGFDVKSEDIVVCSRVGIDSAEEWASKPLRFYVNGNKNISVRDKQAESSLSAAKLCPSTSSTSVKAVSTKKSIPECTEEVNAKKRLDAAFYEKTCEDLAKALLGKKLVRELEEGDIVAGHIVETEAYLGGKDKASHSFGGKKTAKNEAMFMEPGTIYVYSIYGVKTCVNISSQGEGAAVLIRAIDATNGLDVMRKSRGVKRPDEGRGMAEKDLGNGPSKLTQALNISKAEFNKESITESDNIWIQEGFDVEHDDIIVSTRVGIDSAEEWARKPLRFYVRGSKSISVRDKQAE